MFYGERLRTLREEKELNQIQISRILNFHDKVYGQFEREETIMPMKHLNTLSNFFDVSLDYIFSFTDIKNYDNPNLDINMSLSGERLKEFRKENKLTQKKLAIILNTTQSNVVGYEQGKFIIATPYLYTICKKYHISADYLLGKINTPKYFK